MMNQSTSYGVLLRAQSDSDIELAAKEIRPQGFAILDAGYDAAQIESLKTAFDTMRTAYHAKYGTDFLSSIDEHNTIRMPLAHHAAFIGLASNANIMALAAKLIPSTPFSRVARHKLLRARVICNRTLFMERQKTVRVRLPAFQVSSFSPP